VDASIYAPQGITKGCDFQMVSSQGGCLCESARYAAQQVWATQTVERLTATANSYHQHLQLLTAR